MSSTLQDVLAFLRDIQRHSVGYAPNRVYRHVLHDVIQTDELASRVEALIEEESDENPSAE